MKKVVKIEAPKEAVNFFERFLAEKKERKEEVRRKFKNGVFKTE